jgi:uncharacterized membrane protein
MTRLERFQEKCKALARCRYQLRSEPRPEKKREHLPVSTKRKDALVLAATAMLLCAAAPAKAALKLCNRTSTILYAATAAIRSPQSQTQGWTRIVPGDCQVARAEDLTAETYMIYARSSLAYSGPAKAWGGGFPMCAADANFRFSQTGTMAVCKEEGAFALPFAALDTKGRRSWTMTFDEAPVLPSLTAAQLAGVKRLLHDNGYDVGPLDGLPSKKTGAAMAAFRSHVKFPDRGSNAEFFAVLEREALKTNAPAGYTICNDGKTAMEAALADAAKGKVSVRGWWAVPPGACARAITTPLGDNTYYLFARRKDGKSVAEGPEKFCIAATAFEDRQRGDCAAQGQTEVGFQRTPTNGATGYVAHIGDRGLLPGGAPAKP